jgi:hypothetical protein
LSKRSRQRCDLSVLWRPGNDNEDILRTTNMEDLIGSELLSIEALNELADVTRDYLQEAIAEWERKPPNPKFKFVLQAETIET